MATPVFKLDHDKLERERITDTYIAPYDTITAVTQRAINHQLYKMHQVNESLQTLCLQLDDPDDPWSSLNGELSAPTIELLTGTQNRIVIFYLNIKRATLHWLKIKGMTVTEETLEVPESVLAISIDLTFETGDFKKLPQDVQDRLAKLNKYSIQQLLIDFNSASLARLNMEKSTVLERIKEKDKKAAGMFERFILQYFADLAEDPDKWVLHYIPLAPNTEEEDKFPMPTIPPTSLTFENLPFLASPTDTPTSNENNMLVYLQMTEERPLPSTLLERQSNWVVPAADLDSPKGHSGVHRQSNVKGTDNEPGYDGTVALSKKIFHDGWFLPNLSTINKMSTWNVKDAWWSYDGSLLKYKFHFDGGVGWDEAPAAAVQWKSADSKDIDAEIRANAHDAPGNWYKYENYNEKDDNHGAGRAREQGRTKNWCFIPEGYNADGKCAILVGGEVNIDLYVHVDISPVTGWVKGVWSTRLLLDGVNEGEIQFEMDQIVPKITSHADTTLFHGGELDSTIENARTGLADLNMNSLLADLRSVFTNGWDFVIPGGDDFYISKAVFNREKDLLCELKYKFKA